MGRFLRGRAVLAALVLAILAAGALPGGQASAHYYGTIGLHDHGKIYCGSGGVSAEHMRRASVCDASCGAGRTTLLLKLTIPLTGLIQ